MSAPDELLRVEFHRDSLKMARDQDPLMFCLNEIQAILERDRPPEIALYLSTAKKITVTITTE